MAFGVPRRAPSPDFLASMSGALAPDVAPSPGPLAGTMEPATTPAPPIPVNHAIAGALKPKMNWLGILADALSGAAGTTPLYAQSMLRQREQSAEESRYENRLHVQQEYERNKPYHVADNDGNIVQINPSNGTSSVVYHGTPKLSGIAAEIADLKAAGATDADIHTFVGNKIDPIRMASGTDEHGNTVLTPYRTSQFGAQSGPPAVLDTLPPGAIPVSQGGPSPTRSGTFPRRRVP